MPHRVVQIVIFLLVLLLLELQPLLITVPVLAQADCGAIKNPHGREERGGSVALVVVRHGFAESLPRWGLRLHAIERLDLALLIGAQHSRVFRPVETEPHAGLQFLAKPGIAFRITSWILAGVTVGVLPGRGASLSSTAEPPFRKRFRPHAAC